MDLFSGIITVIIASANGGNFMLSAEGNWEEVVDKLPNQAELNSFVLPNGSDLLIKTYDESFGIQYNERKWDLLQGSHFPGIAFENYEFEFNGSEWIATGNSIPQSEEVIFTPPIPAEVDGTA